MLKPEISLNISTEGGVFFQKEVSWPSIGGFSGPVKSTPISDVSERGGYADSERSVAEIYCNLTPVDLESYRAGERTETLQRIDNQVECVRDNELCFLFIEYSEAHDISKQNMSTMIDIQLEYADVITSPMQPTLIEAISPFIDDDHDLENSPMKPYIGSLERFLEIVGDIDKPVFGVLPPVRFEDRGRDILSYYETAGVDSFVVDFRGFKATADIHAEIDDLLFDWGKRRTSEERILYAINYKQYHVNWRRSIHPAEAILLAGSGFDILGGTYHYRGGGGNGSPPDNIKIFNPVSFGYEEISLSEIVESWSVSSTIQPERIANAGENQRRELRRIVNSEQVSIALRKLRAAIINGHAVEFLRARDGLPGEELEKLANLSDNYNNARSANIGDF